MVKRTDCGRDAGQELVEYALILPLLLLLLLGIMEFSRVMMTYNTLSNAAREGARAAVVPMSDSAVPNTVRTAVERVTSHLNPEPAVAVTLNSTTVTVQVTGNVRLIFNPLIQAVGGRDTLTLRAVATMRRE